jgi:hypothetical protein
LAKPHRLRLLAPLGLLVVAAGAVGASASNAFASTPTVAPEGDPLFSTQGSVAPQFLANARTVPHWTFQYTDPTNNVTYTITMAGSDPRLGRSSEIHTVIIPLKMNFVAAGQDVSSLVNQGYVGFVPHIYNHTFDGATKVLQTLASPEFSDKFTYPKVLGADTGQNGDVYMRAQFNQIGLSYHVTLVNDAVLPAVTLNVPSTKGIAYERPVPEWRQANGFPQQTLDLTGLAESNWFSTQLQSLMGSLQIDSTTVPIFLTDNVLLYTKGPGAGYLNCCILGYHGAGMPVGRGAGSAKGQGAQPVQTFMYSAYVTPGTYSGFLSDYLVNPRSTPAPTRGLSDIHALSHEIGEFLDDPFVNNAVLPWKSLTATQYPCTGVLENGDPVVGVWYGLNGNADTNAYGQWHPEDLVFAQWFGHGGIEPVMGASWDGRKTFMGPLNTGISPLYLATFGGYSPGC